MAQLTYFAVKKGSDLSAAAPVAKSVIFRGMNFRGRSSAYVCVQKRFDSVVVQSLVAFNSPHVTDIKGVFTP